MKKYTIALDFDGVINPKSNGWNGGVLDEDPIIGAVAALHLLIKRYEVIIFTCRPDHSNIRQWMDKYGFPAGLEITDKKPNALFFIDDHALRFTNWVDILNYLVRD